MLQLRREVQGLRQALLPSDMLFRMCRKHMRRFLISSRSSLSQRVTVLPRADAHWFWRQMQTFQTAETKSNSPNFREETETTSSVLKAGERHLLEEAHTLPDEGHSEDSGTLRGRIVRRSAGFSLHTKYQNPKSAELCTIVTDSLLSHRILGGSPRGFLKLWDYHCPAVGQVGAPRGGRSPW